jgi:hypothetical protein
MLYFRHARDLAARINWGSGQQLVVSEFDMSGVGERKLLNDIDLSLAFTEKRMKGKCFCLSVLCTNPQKSIGTVWR